LGEVKAKIFCKCNIACLILISTKIDHLSKFMPKNILPYEFFGETCERLLVLLYCAFYACLIASLIWLSLDLALGNLIR